MSVRAKFKCVSNDNNGVRLEAVTGGSSENESFFKYTPWGECKMNVLNDAATAQFKVGKEYYLDFTVAD